MSREIDIITMGCSKNLVDSEHLISKLQQLGFKTYCNPDNLHNGIAVVNTCGFIESAKEESINVILELCQAKEEGKLEKVIVMGCLSQRYKDQLEEEIPQVDKYYGKFNWNQIIDFLKENYSLPQTQSNSTQPCINKRVITTPQHYAYIKISEGCNRNCAYCAIPLITGKQISRDMEDIENEVRALVKQGTKEFQIIAQDSTSYGTDNYHRQALPELIERLSDIPGVEWLRIHYAYPNSFPKKLLQVIRERDNVCKYLDIALQHINNNVLENMHRNFTSRETSDLIKEIREEVPGVALRTTFMVGFPGETQEAFDELLEFTKDSRFERMGAFTFSEEEGTYAAIHYKDNIKESIKQARLDKLMNLQQQISEELCQKRVGDICRVIIDRKENEYYIGRTQYDSPEVDGEVLIHDEVNLNVGDFYNVKITSANEYDLFAELSN